VGTDVLARNNVTVGGTRPAGVTEARYAGEFFDEAWLRAVIADAAAADTDAQHVADGIVAAALDFQRGDARDDMAVVVVKVPTDRLDR
jgi:serine phosphatase RsbU (regulator of sigma subunit)